MSVQDFSKELVAYEVKKSELLALCEGKFALFRGDEFAGVYDSSGSAYAAGVERYGNVPFLIKQVKREEVVEHIPALFFGLIYARS